MSAPIQPLAPESSRAASLFKEEHQQVKSRSNFELSMHRFFRHKLAVFGLIVTSTLVLLAILAPVLVAFSRLRSTLIVVGSFRAHARAPFLARAFSFTPDSSPFVNSTPAASRAPRMSASWYLVMGGAPLSAL